MSETKESSTQTITTTLHHINNNNSNNNIEINIICKKCLKEINYKQIISHDSRCHTELNTCSKCNLKIDINRLERHNLIECKYNDYFKRIEIICPICLDNFKDIPESQRKLTPCGHFICLPCANRNITIRKVLIKEIISNFTYCHEVPVHESKCPKCRKIYEINDLRNIYL
jgi:hypothetical protein